MKNFKEICMLSKANVKTYMDMYLEENGYEPINEDGFLYAKGDVPVLLVAHMDTVHKSPCSEIREVNGIISSPQGIGGDDRCGIFIIMNIVKELHCSVLLCEDEEVGGIGARKFTKTDYIKDLDVNYIIEFDRKGKDDAVFYNCDNKDFTKFVTENTMFKEQHGSFSDISVIAPAAKIAAVNLSCGYYDAHTTKEYVVYKEMMETISEAKTLIKTQCEPFEYIEKKWEMPKFNTHTNPYYYQQSFYDNNKKPLADYMYDDMQVHLEVCWLDENGEEMCDEASGNTKAEAWVQFFMQNPDVSFNMIEDYAFC